MSDDLEFVGSMGWIPGKPNAFDYTVDEESVSPKLSLLNQRPIKDMLNTMGVAGLKESLPASVDLRKWCSKIEDQKTWALALPMRVSVCWSILSKGLPTDTSTPLGCSFTR